MTWDRDIVLAIHGVFMAVGWLVLVPAGVWMSTVGKQRCPEHWFCYHRALMASAMAIILTGAGLAISVTTPHFNTTHAILGPILNVLLVLQALGGWIISKRDTPGNQRPLLNKLHKLLGLMLYMGGLVNGALGLHAYSETLTCRHAIYGLAMLMGVIFTVHTYLLCIILPIWWSNWYNDPQYEHLEIPQP